MGQVGGGTVAVIPIKRLDRAKSRLAGQLSPAERSLLVVKLLDRVLDAVFGSALVGHCLVVSSDSAVRAHAEAAGALAIDEASPPYGQNASLEWGRTVARGTWNPSALLILAGDLPLITPNDLDAISRLGSAAGTVVLAPDHRRVGTNALYLNPSDLLPFRFGPDSLRVHTSDAEARGLHVEIYPGTGTAFDLDLPADLDLIGGLTEIRPLLGRR